LILVTKYRKRVINKDVSEYAQSIFLRISETYHIDLIDWSSNEDNIQIVFKAQPKTELTKFINAYKSASSRLIKKDYPDIRNQLDKDVFWAKSFCLLTTGDVTDEMIESYIQSQGTNNR
ncbi:IS200/IS605 family transposase, partial [Pseudomonas aeruginosa]|uniref:IS200/IS605 family transposase n=1 Tax=Pseudomonas aeruginosa TaxID=287 RepID=UPI0037483122